MSRNKNTQVPSAGLKATAKRAADRAKDSVGLALKAASTEVRARFEQYASQHLGASMAEQYKAGLKVTATESPEPDLVVELEGALPNALEHGFGQFDIKPGLLASASAKQGKNGSTYVDVPIRVDASSVASPIKGLLTKAEHREDELNTLLGMSMAKRANAKKTTSVRAGGVIRQSGGHRVIRRISSNSPSTSWIHPGFAGIHAAKVLANDVYELVMNHVRRFLRSKK